MTADLQAWMSPDLRSSIAMRRTMDALQGGAEPANAEEQVLQGFVRQFQANFDALASGAVLAYDLRTGTMAPTAHDDVAPEALEHLRAARAGDQAHAEHCPDCTETAAEQLTAEAASAWVAGDRAKARELDAEAGELRRQAAAMRVLAGVPSRPC